MSLGIPSGKVKKKRVIMLFYVIGGIIFLLTVGYFFLMFFYPEWVGMSGKVTQKTLAEHKSTEEDKNDLL